MSTEDAPTQEADLSYQGRHRLNNDPVCADCYQADSDTGLVGWSLCAACFHSDRFNGMAYWSPLWCGLLLVAGLSFLVAALTILAHGYS